MKKIALRGLAALLLGTSAQAADVKLAWDHDPVSAGLTEVYQIERQLADKSWTLAKEVPKGTLATTVPGLSAGAHCFRARALGKATETPRPSSDYSNVACGTVLGAPNLTITEITITISAQP